VNKTWHLSVKFIPIDIMSQRQWLAS